MKPKYVLHSKFTGSTHSLVIEDIISHFERHELNARDEGMEYYEIYGNVLKAYDTLMTVLVQLRSHIHEREALIKALVDVLVAACGSRKGLHIDLNANGVRAYENAIELLDELGVWYSVSRDDKGNKIATIEEDTNDD